LKLLVAIVGTLSAYGRWREEFTNMPTKTTTNIIRRIDQEGTVTLRGLHSLTLARAVLEHAVQGAGYAITFDPTSSADLVDYLTVAATSGVEAATIGAGLGGLIGLLFGRPGAGAAIGAGLGLAAGAARGIERVERGWRVRAVRELDGTPSVTIHSLGPA
jgi:hypothetical protein